MTVPEEIRAEVIRRLARVTYEEKRTEWDDIEFRPLWDDLTDEERAPWLAQEGPYVDALGDMLPTGARWGLLVPSPLNPGYVHPMGHEAEAQLYLDDSPGRKIMRQYTYDWQEVTE